MELLLRLAGLGLLICSAITSADGNDLIIKDRSKENISGAASKPYVTILDETEDRSLLQCVVGGASPKPKVEWQDSAGNILPAEEPQVSVRGGSYDITLQTTVNKTDRYRCVVTQEDIKHQTHAETFVYISDRFIKPDLIFNPDRSIKPDRFFNSDRFINPGAAPEPTITILDQTKDWSLLQCVVGGASPEPKVEWQDSAGNILPAEEPQVSERGGSYHITLQTTVTKTDRYRCVVRQEEIKHQTHAEIYVYISEFPNEPCTGCMALSVLVTLLVLLLALLYIKRCLKPKSKKG